MRKKILHVAEPFATGVLSFLLDLTKRQIEDYDITIVWGRRPLTPENVESLFDPRIKLICLESFNGALGSVINPRCYRDLRRIFNEVKPDIVHLHSSASGFVGRWCLPCGKVPVFYNPHGFSFLSGNGNIIKRFVFHAFEWVSAKRKATIIGCSLGEYLVAKKLSKKSTYVNNGVRYEELQKYAKSVVKSEKQRPTVCTVGRILLQKNPKLFNQIAELLPEIDFVWIGDGEMKDELTSPNIKVTGWLDRETTQGIIQESDIFILPSLWEGLPISLLEAMAIGKLCVVSDVIGNRDVIQNGVNGYIATTANEFVDAIKKGLAAQNDTIRKTAQKDVLENYNSDLMAKKYDEIYQSTK